MKDCFNIRHEVYRGAFEDLFNRMDSLADSIIMGNILPEDLLYWNMINVFSQIACENKSFEQYISDKIECFETSLSCIGVDFNDFDPYYVPEPTEECEGGVGYYQIGSSQGDAPPFVIGPFNCEQ